MSCQLVVFHGSHYIYFIIKPKSQRLRRLALFTVTGVRAKKILGGRRLFSPKNTSSSRVVREHGKTSVSVKIGGGSSCPLALSPMFVI